ncbi:MAG: DUF1549 domain-containing protein [Planctomycetes bacterium]|nr:DUF1549 domain-containing protein [Planctomycetota bacterium]MCB9891845.1 DUF1549 domain-containing protein [Planctomycetota bacterium]MCB9918701.1 DUF1549 domain-containing protein [Planctomycetota bacterium]
MIRSPFVSLVVLGIAATTLTAQDTREPEQRVEFRADVLPALERSGCSAAACHGGATGRGGFKLSLFGSDPDADYRAIAEEALGRRIDVADPSASLLLRKPTKRYEHGGGRVLQQGDHAYEVLRQWIARGAPPPDTARSAAIADLRLRLQCADDGALSATAFVQGQERDVTRLAHVFTSNDAAVEVHDVDGRTTVRVVEPGEHWVFVRYQGAVARARVVQPFGPTSPTSDPGVNDPEADDTSVSCAAARVDAAWASSLGQLGLVAGPRADGATWMRRVAADLALRTPTQEELAIANDPQRRLEWSDRILRSEVFRDVMIDLWVRAFELDSETGLPEVAARSVRNLRAALRAEANHIDSLRDVVESVLTDPRLSQIVDRAPDPRDRAEFVSRSLLGIGVACARCHDHPNDRWRRREHLEFSACFVDSDRGSGRLYDGYRDPVEPRLLPLRGAAKTPDASGLRASIVRFVLEDGFEDACRLWCHRVFARLFGRGLFSPVDDQRWTNPARLGAVLDVLTSDMIEHEGRLDRPFRVLVASELYALRSEDESLARDEVAYFARRAVRILDARQRLEVAAGALDLPRPRPDATGSALRDELDARRGAAMWRLVTEPGNFIDVLLLTSELESEGEARVEAKRALATRLFVRVLGREPTVRELSLIEPSVAGDVRDGLREIAFALLSCREFGVLR